MKALIVCPHPDDGEWNAGGTIYKWVQQGAKVTMLITTHSGNVEQRKTHEDEERAAAKILGYNVIFLKTQLYSNMYADKKISLEICSFIRKFKPEIVITMPPYEQNADHFMCYAATLRAALMARCPFKDRAAGSEKILDMEDKEVKDYIGNSDPHTIKEFWICQSTPTQNFAAITPNHYEDISNVFEKKIEALRIHKTKNVNDHLSRFARYVNRQQGKKAGVKYAEAFLKFKLERKRFLWDMFMEKLEEAEKCDS